MKKRLNPFTGEALVAFPLEGVERLRDRLTRLREVQALWAEVAVVERCRLLGEALAYFEAHRDVIGDDIAREMGRPLAQARREVDGLLERARYLASIAPAVLAPEPCQPKEGFERRIEHEPLGVVFVIAAWNYPLLVTINGVMASLLGGNAVLLKQATQTLSIGKHFEEAFGKIPGFEGLLQHSAMGHQTAAIVIETGAVDHVIFTGSVAAGMAVHQSAAKALRGCHLELGGKDAAYVAADADVEAAAECLVDGAMYNSGQSCCGVERVYVHASLHDAFVERCAALIDAYTLGDPFDPTTTLGPLAMASNATVMQAQLADALAKGAVCVRGGNVRKIAEATFFEPTLLTEVTQDMDIMREENFGPILPVMRVADDAEGLRCVNDSRYGLTSIIFTKDRERAERFAQAARTGTVFMNRCDYLDPELPWTGVKDSGMGSALSKYGLLGVTRRKAIHFRL